MSLNKYHHLKNKEIYILIFLIIFSILIRIPAVLIFGDTSLENEWKDIVNNLIENGELLYRGAPNLFMPPLYAFYLYFFSIFKLEGQNYILLILLSQVLLSSISVAMLYKLNKLFNAGIEIKGSENGHYWGPTISHGIHDIWFSLGSAFALGTIKEGKAEMEIRIIMGVGLK